MKTLLIFCIFLSFSAVAGVYDFERDKGLDSAYKLYGYDGDSGLDSSSKLQPRQDSFNEQRYDGDGFVKPQKLKKHKIIRSY